VTAADFLVALVRTESTPGREEAAIRLAATEMTRLGYDEVTIDRYGNLLGRIGHKGRPMLVLDGHIDTIPLYAPEQWEHPPYGAEIADGRLYGLGAVDMKAGVAALIHGAARVTSRDRLHGCAIVSVSIAEEMREGATLARTFGGQEVDWCVIAEPTDLHVATAQRGRARVEVEIWGRSAHAANSAQGINAVSLMMDVAGQIDQLRNPIHPLLGRRDISLIDIHSEPFPSVSTIPGYCVARFDVRFLPGEARDSIISLFGDLMPAGIRTSVRMARNRFNTYTGDDYDEEEFALPWETSRGHEFVRRALQAADAEPSVYGFCTNGSYFAGLRNVPTIGYGPGPAAAAHAIDEYVAIEDLEKAAHGYHKIIEDILG
jgi:putative selenium metabolism hydrolase